MSVFFACFSKFLVFFWFSRLIIIIFINNFGFEIFFGRMSTETLTIKFTGKNYVAWEFQFKTFLKGKELLSHIDGSFPTPEEGKELSQWEANDARIISWILGSIKAHMVNNLGSFSTTKEMWDYLQCIYHQDNPTR